MRTLILGANRRLNLAAAKQLNLSIAEWSVITSYSDAVEEWTALGVDDVKLYRKHKPVPTERGLVLDVIGETLFRRSWLKGHLSDNRNLVVLTSKPHGLLNPGLAWDKVLVTRTADERKLMQFYYLHVDPDDVSSDKFMEMVKGLSDDSYLPIIGRQVQEPVSAAEATLKTPRQVFGEQKEITGDGPSASFWFELTTDRPSELKDRVTGLLSETLVHSMLIGGGESVDGDKLNLLTHVHGHKADAFIVIALRHMFPLLRREGLLTSVEFKWPAPSPAGAHPATS